MANSFTGFPPDLFAFLDDLSHNNNRQWFTDHKSRYEDSIIRPMGLFISDFGSRLDEFAPQFIADPRRHGGSMFRIYRDTRFARDKRPYKEHVGCQFRHRLGRSAHAPGFYLHLEPAQVFFGAGVWKPDGPSLHRIRTAIAENHDHWLSITTDSQFSRRFNELQGEKLKRPPRGFRADDPAIEDLKYKSFFVLQFTTPDQALLPGFIDTVERSFRTASPLLAFLTDALGLPY